MDFDAIIIGSGFGGAISGRRLAEAGMKVLMLERGRWWDSKSSPGKTPYPREFEDPWIWSHANPEIENGWIDFRCFRHMSVVQGAAVGGGSLIYANISCEAPPEIFEDGWPPEITYQEIKPYYDQVKQFMNVQQVPRSQWSKRTELMHRTAETIGQPQRFQQLELAVSFDQNWNYDLDDCHGSQHSRRFVNPQGVEQGTCIHLGNCDIGCDADARNTLDRNYIPAGMKRGMEVRPLHIVTNIEPVNGGYKVYYDRLENGARIPGSNTAERVIVAAGSLGSTELMLRCKEITKSLPNVSAFLGKDWSSNGDFLTPAFHPFDVWPERGPTISSVINYQDRSDGGHRYWIQDGGFPNLVKNYLTAKSHNWAKNIRAKILLEGIQHLLQKDDPFHGVMPWFAQGVDAANGDLSLRRPWWFFGKKRLSLDWEIEKSKPVMDAICARHELLARATKGVPLLSPAWSLCRDLVTPHPLGGCNIGTGPDNGVVNHKGEVFGYPRLYVCDGSVVPEALGVNPSRTIGALAERTATLMLQS